MRTLVYSTKPYDRRFLEAANSEGRHELVFLEPRLARQTVATAIDADAVCVFVNDELDELVLEALQVRGTRLVALRCAGFNNVNLAAARRVGITVCRVPEYSPYSVAEHTVGLILTLNRKIHRAHLRVREGNFALDGLLGFDLHGKNAGVIGTGKIGAAVVRIMSGFGCTVYAYDPYPNQSCIDLGARYVDLDELLAACDIITLHCPLTPDTRHLIGRAALKKVRRGMMLVNTSRGGVIHTRAVIEALKNGTVGALAIDVYEEEADLFFENLSDTVIQDDVFARLLTFPNVLITAHQAFFTNEALSTIASTTLGNITAFETTGQALHEVSIERIA
jgi:D-lactate dehydrogenase